MKRTIGLLAATASFALLPLGMASADYPVDDPEITVESGSPGPGEQVTVAIANFCPNAQVAFFLEPGANFLGQVQADGTGHAEFTFTAPAAGSYTVRAESAPSCGLDAEVDIEVGAIVPTGAESSNTLELGLLVLGAGTLLIGAASWRRRTVGA